MSNGEIERAIRQALGNHIHVVKFHSWLFHRRHPLSRQLNHSGAGFNYYDARVPIALEQARKKTSITFAQNQHPNSLGGA